MSKYGKLALYFQAQTADFFRLTFDEVERAAGFKLPASARLHQAWWANDRARHVQARAWLDAGYESEQVDMKAGALAFRKVKVDRTPPRHGSMSDPARPFRPAHIPAGAEPARCPLFGALKGTFWIEPAWNPAGPAFSAAELAQLFANIERMADRIEAGLSRKSG